ncbi:hypothetical protein ACRN9T_21030 [Shewanella baltica]|uniref:hypothetical protein n=1 Tax=Shewanella baltica TaxID=62322 RepID=UPI003D7AC765
MHKFIFSLFIVLSFSANANDLCQTVDGSTIIAQDNENTYLGKITNSFDSDSIFNDFGTYGNEFSGESIWNQFSTFGNEFNSDSPFNEFSASPPMIIKNKKLLAICLLINHLKMQLALIYLKLCVENSCNITKTFTRQLKLSNF